MIEKFACACGKASSELIDLYHASNSMILVSLMIPKFAPRARYRTLANFGIGTLAP